MATTSAAFLAEVGMRIHSENGQVRRLNSLDKYNTNFDSFGYFYYIFVRGFCPNLLG